MTHAADPANSALLAQSWEISVSGKMRGGPGRNSNLQPSGYEDLAALSKKRLLAADQV